MQVHRSTWEFLCRNFYLPFFNLYINIKNLSYLVSFFFATTRQQEVSITITILRYLPVLGLLHSQVGNKPSEQWLSKLSSETGWLHRNHMGISLFTVHGVCYNLPSGDNTIDLRTQIYFSYMYVGAFSRASRLYVDELSIRSTTYSSEPAVASCPGLSFFNTREFARNGELGYDSNTEVFVSTWNWSLFMAEIQSRDSLKLQSRQRKRFVARTAIVCCSSIWSRSHALLALELTSQYV